MLPTKAYAVMNSKSEFIPHQIERREPGPNDVLIHILYCGICHSDIHQARNEWGGGSLYPMVPGHEIVGRVTRAGAAVKRFKDGDLVGVGCFVDSCRHCENCRKGEEQYCAGPLVLTYNSLEKDQKTMTYGGYSSQIVVDENYVLHVSDKLDLKGVAPLLCAGITTYSPLAHWKVGKGHRVGVIGLGGLGHMAVKLASSMGAEVTVLSTSPSKKEDAKKLGAHEFALTRDSKEITRLAGYFDFILDTVSAKHDVNLYLNLVRTDGTMVLLGVPDKPLELGAFSLIRKRVSLAGSLIGGIKQTQEMLDYCASHNITADVEVIPADYIDTAYERMLKNDVHYRFVIDAGTLE